MVCSIRAILIGQMFRGRKSFSEMSKTELTT